MATTTNLDSLVINYLTQAQYDEAAQAGTLNANQLYLTPDTGGPTGTLSSVGVSNATNGGLTVSGSPLTSDGTITIGHSNVLSSAQTTQAVYPIKIDKNGHISAYGSAVTISDTKVTQNYSTASGGHPILMTPEANISSTSSRGDTTAILTNAIYATPSTGNLQATTFNGYTLAAASAKAVDTSISAASTSTNLPTSAAVASFVEGKGYITSDSDEKLKVVAITTSATYYPVLSSATTTAETKLYTNLFEFYRGSDYEVHFGVGKLNTTLGKIRLYTASSGGRYGIITPDTLTGTRTWTFPDKTGTVALTSDIPTIPTNISAFTNDSGYITSADVPEGASAYTGTISEVGTTASNGTNNGFARGDHVHNITSATIISALGYTPYNSTNPNGYISSYTDENMKWTASTSSNTYYPLQSTSTATTSTANTLNSVSFYQYYNTAGGYRRLILGNSTAYTSTGGAYGTIRLFGAPATYYGDLVPGVLSTSSTGRLTANRTWTLPDKTGTVALTSDIPSVPTSAASATTGITASTTANTTSVSGSDSFSATVTSHVLSFSHSAKTVSTSSATVTITDNGHTHTLS